MRFSALWSFYFHRYLRDGVDRVGDERRGAIAANEIEKVLWTIRKSSLKRTLLNGCRPGSILRPGRLSVRFFRYMLFCFWPYQGPYLFLCVSIFPPKNLHIFYSDNLKHWWLSLCVNFNEKKKKNRQYCFIDIGSSPHGRQANIWTNEDSSTSV